MIVALDKIKVPLHDPHSFLGLHPYKDKRVIRLYRPGAASCHIVLGGETREMKPLGDEGLFELVVPKNTQVKDYRVYHNDGSLGLDPYSFIPTFGELDQYLFSKGTHYQLYEVLGGRIREHQGVKGAAFTVWAPSAKGVALVADFNHFDGRVNPLRSLGFSGVWEIFIPGEQLENVKYKFEIRTEDGQLLLKTDPMGLYQEMRPKNASILFDSRGFAWSDREWLDKQRTRGHLNYPINIYEVHLGSWKKADGAFLNYREYAKQLAAYCNEMGYTHIELLPICEHPLDESWGYQVTGYYAPTSRYGNPDDFKAFVDELHSCNIGVLMDWVPGHFPSDASGLARFDGTALYEHYDPKEGWHPHWHTYIFNWGRHEVSNFLIANALYWLEEMHIDGLRVDAVASMLYRDYGREFGEWIPNVYGGKENIEAIEFLRHLNSVVHRRAPGKLMIAEESTSFGGVTHPVEEHGLGFDLKWNMGWMNDTLRYFSKDSIYRRYHHNDLTFGLLYAFSEKFISVLSHDEVVHGKNSLIGRMPGDMWQQFANARLLISYMMCNLGKKLLFMGGEIGQWNEWNCKGEVEWFLLRYPSHDGLKRMCKEINHLYLEQEALWALDFHYTGFEWVDFKDVDNCIISYLRKSQNRQLLCLHNFTPSTHSNYYIHLENVREIRLLFNSDMSSYGGSGKGLGEVRLHKGVSGRGVGIELEVAPLATQIYEITFG